MKYESDYLDSDKIVMDTFNNYVDGTITIRVMYPIEEASIERDFSMFELNANYDDIIEGLICLLELEVVSKYIG